MPRASFLLAAVLAVTAIAFGRYSLAQDEATSPADGTPAEVRCATPLPETTASPEAVVTAPTTAATPGGAAPGTPVGLFPCPTPINPTPQTEAQGAPDDAGDAAQVTVEMVDIAFAPTELAIPANTDVPFHFVNNGVIVHNFRIDDPEVFSGDLEPGASSDLVVNLPAGTYEYYCSIPGHREAGMVGTLTVE